MLNVDMVSVVRLNVVMLRVLAPNFHTNGDSKEESSRRNRWESKETRRERKTGSRLDERERERERER